MTLLDSSMLTAVIAGKAEPADFFHQDLAISEITKVAILGDPDLSTGRLRLLEQLLAAIQILPVTEAVISESIRLRQTTKLSLHDALLAGTAFAYQITLSTDRPELFRLAGVVVHNPLDSTQRALNELLHREAESDAEGFTEAA